MRTVFVASLRTIGTAMRGQLGWVVMTYNTESKYARLVGDIRELSRFSHQFTGLAPAVAIYSYFGEDDTPIWCSINSLPHNNVSLYTYLVENHRDPIYDVLE